VSDTPPANGVSMSSKVAVALLALVAALATGINGLFMVVLSNKDAELREVRSELGVVRERIARLEARP
jgi:hypothetical protein